jgi:hypothetical protein
MRDFSQFAMTYHQGYAIYIPSDIKRGDGFVIGSWFYATADANQTRMLITSNQSSSWLLSQSSKGPGMTPHSMNQLDLPKSRPNHNQVFRECLL